jgi:hypothetical protein
MVNEEAKPTEIKTVTKQNDSDFPPVKKRSEKQIAWSKQLGQNSQKFKKEKREKETKKLQEKEFQEKIKIPDIEEINETEEINYKENTKNTSTILLITVPIIGAILVGILYLKKKVINKVPDNDNSKLENNSNYGKME